MSIEIIEVTLPASWASALVNNDWTGLQYYDPQGAQEAREWLRSSGLSVLSCDEHATMQKYNGVLTEVLVYYCTRKKQE